ARTAGPLLLLRVRNWMPPSSVAIAIAPPSASTSFTRWPLPMPPMLGLQLIWPSVSMLWVSSSVAQPIRAAASAASVPAWPPPTTMTSNSCGYNMVRTLQGHRHPGEPDQQKLFHVKQYRRPAPVRRKPVIVPPRPHSRCGHDMPHPLLDHLSAMLGPLPPAVD